LIIEEILKIILGGHDPDTYLLKIRSREHKIIEVQLAIYSTTDWYSHRTKILSKIEEVRQKIHHIKLNDSFLGSSWSSCKLDKN
jgi:hypothetical protein